MSDIPREPLPKGDGERDLPDEISDDDLGPDGGGDDEEEAAQDEGADDESADEESQEGEDVVPSRPRSRGQRDYGRLRGENRDLRERIARLEGQQQAPRQPLIDPATAQREQRERLNREYQERFQQDPQAASMWLWEQGAAQIGSALQQQEWRMLDRQDEREWNRSLQSDRIAQRYRNEVEEDVRALRANGQIYIDRQMLLERRAGQDMLRRARQEGPRQRQAAARRVQRQTVRPGSGRGDGAANRGRRGSQEEEDDEILRNTPVGNF